MGGREVIDPIPVLVDCLLYHIRLIVAEKPYTPGARKTGPKTMGLMYDIGCKTSIVLED
jgi:hypothetical protein